MVVLDRGIACGCARAEKGSVLKCRLFVMYANMRLVKTRPARMNLAVISSLFDLSKNVVLFVV